MEDTLTIDTANSELWVDEKTDREEFDVLEFVSDAIVPEDTVRVYRDANSARKLNLLLEAEAERNEKIAELEKANRSGVRGLDDEFELDVYIDPEELEALELEMEELREKIEASALIFHIKGLAPAAQKALDKHLRATTGFKEGTENAEFNEKFNTAVIAKSIDYVETADGRVDRKPWTPERVKAFEEQVYPSEFVKLWAVVGETNFSFTLFDQVVSADF